MTTTSNSGICSLERSLLARLLLRGQLRRVAAARLRPLDAEIEEGGAEALDLLPHRRPDVEARDDCSEPPRRRDRLQAGDAGAEDEHLRRRDRPCGGHQQREEPWQPVGGGDDRLVARDGALRRECVHRLRTRDPRDRFHREGDDAALGEPLDPGRIAERGEEADEDDPRRELCNLVGRGPGDADDGLRARQQLAAVDDVGAGGRVVGVREPGGRARASLDCDREARRGQAPDRVGHERHPALAGAGFFRDCDPHGERTLRSEAVGEGREPGSALESRATWGHCSQPSPRPSRRAIPTSGGTPPA